MGRWSFLRNLPVKPSEERGRKQTDSRKQFKRRRAFMTRNEIFRSERDNKYLTAKKLSWGRGGRNTVVVENVPLLCFVAETLTVAPGKSGLALL